jgi:S-adenosylmethionine:tRNA ribosyltransferase-isomerase
MSELNRMGIQSHFVTLHVGLGTFAPVKAEELSKHVMHEEQFQITAATAAAINAAKAEGRRVVAVGTTSLRVLECVTARNAGPITAAQGRTRIFVHPPYQFCVVDALLTNFHLPRSTLLMLVSAFAAPGSSSGRELVLDAYQEAIRNRYRFYSYGDAMLIV